MKYDDVRPHLRTGDIIAYRGNRLFSRLIRAFNGSDFSHVGMVWEVGSGDLRKVWLIESMEGRGVTIRALSHTGDFVWVPLRLDLAQQSRLALYFENSVGRGLYSWWGVIGQLFYPVFGKYRWFDRVFRRKNATFCSDFVSIGLRKVGWEAPLQPSPSKLIAWAAWKTDDRFNKGIPEGFTFVSNDAPEPLDYSEI
jgi:hypothetical protein